MIGSVYDYPVDDNELHEALRSTDAGVEEIRRIIRDSPGCVRKRGLGDLLPLHLMFLHGRSLELDVMRLLLKADPDALAAKSAYGRTPLSLACSINHRAEIDDDLLLEVLKLLSTPETIREPDDRGMYPAHSFALGNAELHGGVLLWFLQEFPECARQVFNVGGRTLLHCVLSAAPDIAVEVAEAYPEALQLRDRQGRSPLDLVYDPIVLQRMLPFASLDTKLRTWRRLVSGRLLESTWRPITCLSNLVAVLWDGIPDKKRAWLVALRFGRVETIRMLVSTGMAPNCTSFTMLAHVSSVDVAYFLIREGLLYD